MDDNELTLAMATAAAEATAKESANMIASAISCAFPFATAKRDAVKTYIEEIKKSDLPPDAKMFAIANVKDTFKHLSNQSKIKEIAESAAKEGTDFSANSGVREEFVDRFMDSAKFVSDEEMQVVWGQILAKEFEKPGSTPPKLIRILSEITPRYANIFQNICSLSITLICMNIQNQASVVLETPFIKNQSDLVLYTSLGINLDNLNELSQMGLIQFEPITGYRKIFNINAIPTILIAYGNNNRIARQYTDKHFPIGEVLLTDAGMALAKVTERKVIEGHFDFVIEEMKKNGVIFAEISESIAE